MTDIGDAVPQMHFADSSMDSLIDSFIQTALNEIPHDVRDGDLCVVERSPAYIIRQEVVEAVARTKDYDFAKTYFQEKSIPGTKPMDFLDRLVFLPGSECGIIGIRFQRGDILRPFIEITARSFSLSTREHFDYLAEEGRNIYQAFRPASIGFKMGCKSQLHPELKNRISTWYYFVAGRLTRLQSSVKKESQAAIHLERVFNPVNYEEYEELYKLWERSNANFFELANPESYIEFSECIQDGLVFRASIEGTLIGYIIARQGQDFCVSGHVLIEIVVVPVLTRKGYGSEMLRLLIEKLPSDDCSFLFAHIQARNVASLRTAKSNGMEPVGCMQLLHFCN